MKVMNTVVDWLDDRTGLKAPIVHALTHLVPPGATWAYVLGTSILTSFILQIVTGVALSTLYIPSAGEAFESIRYITLTAPFGNLVRGMHYFGASAMILFIGLHTIRVYLWGSYKFPRELNWLTGVVLLFSTVGMGFTGQILRWDQTAIWTVAVGAEQARRAPFIGKTAVQMFLAGGNIGTSTLSHFFALHVFILPALIIATVGLHLYLVLHNGISEPPVAGQPVDKKTYRSRYNDMLKREGRPFWPDAAWRDLVFSTVVVLGILSLAIVVGPPHIETPPDPSLVNAEPKPDWYLLWYFALLALLPHRAEDFIIIGAPIAGILGLLAVPFISVTKERSLSKRPWALGIVLCIVATVGALWREGTKEPWTPKFSARPLTPTTIGTHATNVYDGAKVFNDKGCLYCHTIAGHGGHRGPDLTYISDRLTHDQIVIRIINGGTNMPAYAGNIKSQELKALTDFLESRTVK